MRDAFVRVLLVLLLARSALPHHDDWLFSLFPRAIVPTATNLFKKSLFTFLLK